MEARDQFKVTELKGRIVVKIPFIKHHFEWILDGENTYRTAMSTAEIITWDQQKLSILLI